MLLDTTFLIDLQRDLSGRTESGALGFLKSHPQESSAISLMSWLEFAEGYTEAQEEECRLFLHRFRLIIPDLAVAWRTSRIARHLRNSGAPIADHDLWIAATAIHFDLPLVTRNTRHFRRIPDLKVASY